MRRLLTIMAAWLVAYAVHAAPGQATISVTTGTNDTGTATDSTFSGEIDEIVLVIPTGSSVTGTVAVTATSPAGNAVTLASATIDATTLVRPRVDATDAGGSAVTADETWRYYSYGDAITATVTSANTTGLTWEVWIKYIKDE